MLTLHSSRVEFRGNIASADRTVLRLSEQLNRPIGLRSSEVFFSRTGSELQNVEGFRAVACLQSSVNRLSAENQSLIVLPEEFSYLADGDVIAVEPQRRSIRTLYRRNSNHNSFLVTERCNHYCLMCSQPPREINDDWLVSEIIEALKLVDIETGQIGLTGGEPTLLGDDFLRIVRSAEAYLPRTALHILSNGRRFSDPEFSEAFASIRHHDLMLGIPLYSDISTIHDYVVQSDGAYDETLRGILNLKQRGQRIELRVVVHRQTYGRLPQLAEFIARNLTFVDQVSLMGLEITGFTRANLDSLWIDPAEYKDELAKAVGTLSSAGMRVLIFNHQLCLLRRALWPFAVKSISDWKNEYMPECKSCTMQEKCGGFFSSAKLRYSDHIRPIGLTPELT